MNRKTSRLIFSKLNDGSLQLRVARAALVAEEVLGLVGAAVAVVAAEALAAVLEPG